MFKVNIKGVTYGVLLFFFLLLISSVSYNNLGVNIVSVPIYWIYLASWVFPGYFAAKVSGKNGVINGAMVGIIVGIIVGSISQIFFTSPPPNIQSISGIGISILMGVAAAILCSLGGLIWQFRNRPPSNGL